MDWKKAAICLALIILGTLATGNALGLCKPECKAIGTRSEGWYDSCTGKVIKWVNCANCEVKCMEAEEGEGWYAICENQTYLIAKASCSESEKNESFTYCQKARRGIVCTQIYSPVCAKVKTTTGQTIWKTYSNACIACEDPNVIGYKEGACEEESIRCEPTSYSGVYKCEIGGEEYHCVEENIAKTCKYFRTVQLVNFNNTTLKCLPPNCEIRMVNDSCSVICTVRAQRVGPGPIEEIPERNQRFYDCINAVRNWGGEITEREARAMCGFLAGPRYAKYIDPYLKCLAEKFKENVTFVEAKRVCLQQLKRFRFREMFENCVSNLVRQGYNRSEAVKSCAIEYNINLTRILANVSEERLAVYIHCLNAPNEIKEKVKEIIEQIKNIQKERGDKVREIVEKCRNITGNESSECYKEIEQINKEYNEKIRNLMIEFINVTKNVTLFVNTTCLAEKLEKIGVTIPLEELTISGRNATKVIAWRLRKEIRRNPIIIRAIAKNPELRKVFIKTFVKNKTLLKEIIKNTTERRQLIQALKEDKIFRKECLHLMLKFRETRRIMLREILRERELKREILQNKTLLAEILPPKLKARVKKLKFLDLNVTRIRNQEVYKAIVERKGRLLGIIPVTIKEEIEFNNTQVIREKKPWWAFLVFG